MCNFQLFFMIFHAYLQKTGIYSVKHPVSQCESTNRDCRTPHRQECGVGQPTVERIVTDPSPVSPPDMRFSRIRRYRERVFVLFWRTESPQERCILNGLKAKSPCTTRNDLFSLPIGKNVPGASLMEPQPPEGVWSPHALERTPIRFPLVRKPIRSVTSSA